MPHIWRSSFALNFNLKMAPSTAPAHASSTIHAPQTRDEKIEAFFHLKASLVYFIFFLIALVVFLVLVCLLCRCYNRYCRQKKRRLTRHNSTYTSARIEGEDDDADTGGAPRFKYALEFNTASNILTVTCIEAVRLPGKESDMDSFVRISTEPPNFGGHVFVEKSTKVVRRNVNPAWKEKIFYNIPPAALQSRSIAFRIWNQDVGSVDSLVGSLAVNLKDMPATKYFNKRAVFWETIELSHGSAPPNGELCLVMRYEHRAVGYELLVTVVEARGLPLRTDRHGDVQVCASFHVAGQRVCHKATKKRHPSPNPYFNENFLFWTDLATEILSATIKFKVTVRRGILGKRCIAEVRIGADVGDKEQRRFWENMLANPRHQFPRWYPLLPPNST